MIFLEPERQDAVEGLQRLRPFAELEEHLAVAGQGVLVVRVQRPGPLEAPPRPGDILPREVGIRHPDVEFHGVGIELDAVLEEVERLVEAAFVVELVGVFVVVVGAEKPIRH